MNKKIFKALIFFAAIGLVSFTNQAEGQEFFRPGFMNAGEPGWSPYVIARGPERQIIQSTPMELRPYRPLHFYGNTVRRTYYRGTPLVMPRDVFQGALVQVRRRQ